MMMIGLLVALYGEGDTEVLEAKGWIVRLQRLNHAAFGTRTFAAGGIEFHNYTQRMVYCVQLLIPWLIALTMQGGGKLGGIGVEFALVRLMVDFPSAKMAISDLTGLLQLNVVSFRVLDDM